MYQTLIRWFKPRLRQKPAEDGRDPAIHGPERYVRDKIADATAKEVAFWGESTAGMHAASRYR
jgi:hypothetical protein